MFLAFIWCIVYENRTIKTVEIPHFKMSCISHRAALNDFNNDIRIPTIVAQTRALTASARRSGRLATPSGAAAIEAKIQMAKAKTNRARRRGHLIAFDSLYRNENQRLNCALLILYVQQHSPARQ